MTDTTEQKALALLNEVLDELKVERQTKIMRKNFYAEEALCRAIEQHEAFRQEVSDAVEEVTQRQGKLQALLRFIIAKPDPLVEVISRIFPMATNGWDEEMKAATARSFRAAIEKRGGKIIFNEE